MYRQKIRLVAACAVLTVSLAAALAIWSVRASDRHYEQARLAHQLLGEHQSLSVYCYRLFKQLTDEIVLGKAANQSVVRNKRSAIADSLSRIREFEWQQRLSLGAEAAPNAVEDTDALQALIESIIGDFEALLQLPAGPVRAQQLDVMLEDRIDVGFREAINAALERQARVVREMEQRVAQVHGVLISLSAALALAAILVSLFGGHMLLRGIDRPLRALRDGANKLEQGQLSHRVPRGFDSEFDDMANAFNSMAAQLETQHASREDARRALEKAVTHRTTELTQANDALQRSDQVRRQFFADVSHELRTPLTVIRGEAQVALRGRAHDSETFREALQAILDQSVGLSRLVEDMLFVARTDSQSLRLNRRICDPQALSQDVLRDLRQTAADKAIELQLTPTNETPSLVADPDRLRQLLIILIDNAIRYSPSDSQVNIGWHSESDQLVLEVRDQGHGIDAQDLPHIFDRFFRGHHASEDSGTGLGLAVAKAIVVAHGGRIEADSTPARGTCIRASFALAH